MFSRGSFKHVFDMWLDKVFHGGKCNFCKGRGKNTTSSCMNMTISRIEDALTTRMLDRRLIELRFLDILIDAINVYSSYYVRACFLCQGGKTDLPLIAAGSFIVIMFGAIRTNVPILLSLTLPVSTVICCMLGLPYFRCAK